MTAWDTFLALLQGTCPDGNACEITDPDADQVDFTPKRTTVDALRALPISVGTQAFVAAFNVVSAWSPRRSSCATCNVRASLRSLRAERAAPPQSSRRLRLRQTAERGPIASLHTVRSASVGDSRAARTAG